MRCTPASRLTLGSACQAQHLLRAGSQSPRAIWYLTEGVGGTNLIAAAV